MRKQIWNIISKLYPFILRKIYKMNIGENAVISYKANLDKSINPTGIYIGKNTWVLANSMILAHDHCRNLRINTCIGDNCVIGIGSIILPGVIIGSHVIVGAGAVVSKDIPDHCIVVGNPARIIKEGVWLNEKGKIIESPL